MTRRQNHHSRGSARRIQRACAVEPLETRILLSGVTFTPLAPVTLPYSATSMTAGNLLTSGAQDVVVADAHYPAVTLLIGTANGTFSLGPTLPTAAGIPSRAAIADINGDGVEDIITANTPYNGDGGSISILLGNGDGTFKPAYVIPNTSAAPTALVVGNFNGHPDIAVTNALLNTVQVLLFNGDGTLDHSTESVNAYVSFPYSMVDANVGGYDGLVVSGILSGNAILLQSDGQGHFSAKSLPIASAGVRRVAIAQLNGDGAPEIILGGYKSLSAILANPSGGFQPSVTTGAYAPYDTALAAADFSGDGIPDVVSINKKTGALGISIGLPGGAFAPPQSLVIPHLSDYDPVGVATVDANGDGKPDLLVAQGNTLSVLLNTTPSSALPAAPHIVTAPQAILPVGAPSSFTIATLGSPDAAITEVGNLPAGITLHDYGDGLASLSGVPAPGTAGNYDLAFYATNDSGGAGQSFLLTIAQAPAITTANTTSMAIGLANTFTINAGGFPTPSLTETGALPAGLSFADNGDGAATLAGQPDDGTDGTYSLTFTAANTPGTASQSFILTITPGLTITTDPGTAFTTTSSGTFTVVAAGADSVSLTETGALPSGVTFFDNGDGTATLSGTPAAGTGGVYDVQIQAISGPASANQDFTLTINQPPIFTSPNSGNFTTGVNSSITILTNGFPDGALTEAGRLPIGVNFVDNGNGTATLAGQPAAGTRGNYRITLTANNAVAPAAMQTYTLNVNQAPAFSSAAGAAFNASLPNAFIFTTTGFPAANLVIAGRLPAGLSFIDNGDGTATLAGKPAASDRGPYHLSITAHNGILTAAEQTFTLTVLPTHAPAFRSASHATFTTGAGGTFKITAAAYPAATFVLTGTPPAGVSLVNNNDGTAILAGTPAANAGGKYRVTLFAINGIGTPVHQVFTLTIDQPPAITAGPASAAFAPGIAGSFAVAATGFPAPTFSRRGTLPAGLHFKNTGNGGASVWGKPATRAGGTYALIFSADNHSGPSAVETLTLTVAPPPPPPVVSPANTAPPTLAPLNQTASQTSQILTLLTVPPAG